ncbi:MAG: mechanosensitive ion channel domain-containing protein [Pseudomonadota bacterium]
MRVDRRTASLCARARVLIPALALALALALLDLAAPMPARAAPPADWTGQWQTFWRDGRALMTLEQEGDTVTGTFEPGAGRIEGRVDGAVLRGTWSEGAIAGGIVFALSPDGESFTGRFDSGEYWNGRRLVAGTITGPRFSDTSSPRETLRTLVVAVNDVLFNGDVAALNFLPTLLVYEGDSRDERALNRRRTLLWDLIDLSTFHVYDAPPRPPGDTARFAIGPAGSDVQYTLRFRRGADGGWNVVVEEEAALRAAIARFLAALGHPSVASAKAARARSPRGTMRAFILATYTWEEGGRARALATLDLSFVPSHLRVAEGSIRADYLKQIIDRAGFVIWQEIPDNPDRTVPYVHYQHAEGSVVIERIPDAAGPPGAPGAPGTAPAPGPAHTPGTVPPPGAGWRFSAKTLQRAPALFDAMQDLPRVEGLSPSVPVTGFFALRQQIRQHAPYLSERSLLLENWQWLALAACLLGALALAWLAARAMRRLSRLLAAEGRDEPDRHLEWAVSIATAGFLFSQAFVLLGVVDTNLSIVHRAFSVLTALSVTWMAYRSISLIGGAFSRRAEATTSYVDEMVTSLAMGMLKLGVVVAGIVACAEIVELPYEGVLAGLGVGGIALAFAARETVTNMLGGMLLITDRPFKRGDLIETGSDLAVVESVGLRSTRMRRLDDTVLILPNAQLSDKAIVNWGLRKRRLITLDIGLTYDTPRARLDAFVDELRDLIRAQPTIDERDCYVALKNFGASSIDIECRFFALVFSYDAQIAARHAVVGEIIALAERMDIAFAFPTRTVHLLHAPTTLHPPPPPNQP